MHHLVGKLLSILSLAILVGSAAAEYPTKPIRIIVPFPAGTATDTVSRVLANALAPSLGQPVIIVNQAGADGAIGATEVARAVPDGYTLLMSTNGFCAVPAMRKTPPYDPTKDFTPISMFGRYSFFLFVNSSVPANSLQELLAYARTNPGKLNYATGNPTGIVATGQILSLAGNLDMVQVPYKGEPAGMLDLVANRVQVMIGTPTTAGQYVKAGKLRMLATTLPARSPAYPDVPTIAEAGLPKFSVPSWAALQGPPKMPKEIVDRLASEMAAVLKRQDVLEQLTRQQFLPDSSTPEQLAAFIREQLDLYAKTLKESGVQPQ